MDIFASSFFMLTRWEEYVDLSRDEHNRFPHTASLAYKHNFLDRPIVNEYIEFIWNMFLELGYSRERAERKFSILLTHDVDEILRYPNLKKVITGMGGDVLFRKSIFLPFKTLYDYTLVSIKKRKDPFAIRIKEGHRVRVGRGERRVKELFGTLMENTPTYYRTKKTIYGYQHLSLVAIKRKDEYMIIATNIKQEKALDYYKRRWEIETLFSAFKMRGFNLEETHLSENKKIDSMVAILSLAFVWCHVVGEWLNEIKPIKLLKHGRKAKSLFLYGFECLDEIFSNYEIRSKELAWAMRMFNIGDLKIDDY